MKLTDEQKEYYKTMFEAMQDYIERKFVTFTAINLNQTNTSAYTAPSASAQAFKEHLLKSLREAKERMSL